MSGCRSLRRAQVTLLREDGSIREDLMLPKGTEEADRIAAQLKVDYADGKEIVVTVLKVGRREAGALERGPWIDLGG